MIYFLALQDNQIFHLIQHILLGSNKKCHFKILNLYKRVLAACQHTISKLAVCATSFRIQVTLILYKQNHRKTANRMDTQSNFVFKFCEVWIRPIYLTFSKCKQTNKIKTNLQQTVCQGTCSRLSARDHFKVHSKDAQ